MKSEGKTVTVSWYDDAQSITLYTLVADWKWDDLFSAVEYAREFENSVSYRMDAIIDATQFVEIPDGFFDNMRRIVWKQPPNIRLTVIATPSRVIQLWLRAAGNIIPIIRKDYHATLTVEEAVQLIEKDRAKLALHSRG